MFKGSKECSNVCCRRRHVAAVKYFTYLTVINIVGKGKKLDRSLAHNSYRDLSKTSWIHEFSIAYLKCCSCISYETMISYWSYKIILHSFQAIENDDSYKSVIRHLTTPKSYVSITSFCTHRMIYAIQFHVSM